MAGRDARGSCYNGTERMKDLDERDGWPESEGEEAGIRSPTPFDPLFSPWDEAIPEAAPAEPEEKTLWLEAAAPSAGVAWTEDALAWEVPAADVLRSEFQTGVACFPDRYTHAQRLSEYQRLLREGTVVVPRPERRWAVTVRELAETLLLALLIFLSVRASFQNFRVEGVSMNPSLENGEYLIVNKLAYATIDLSTFNWLPFFNAGDHPVRHLWGKPSRGDVIVFRAPTSPNRDFIKRIIGLPGDTVEINSSTGQVFINGAALQERYTQGVTSCSTDPCRWRIPEEGSPEALAQCGSQACYFVLGDNRQNSSDSRQGWLVPEENIIGKALVTYWRNGGPEFDLAPNHSVSLADSANAQE